MNRSSHLLGGLLLTISVAAASPVNLTAPHAARAGGPGSYEDQASQLRFNVPSGWWVRAETLNGVRQLRVVPPRADQRERAAIQVEISVRPFARGESLERLAQHYRTADQDREAAQILRYSPKLNRLVLEYREGSYVSGQLWIVRHNLVLFQRVDHSHLLVARCAANASEYKTYRHNLETICASVVHE
jgi:hypothetical protein